MRLRHLMILALLLAVAGHAGVAVAATPPVDRAGPPLSVPESQLAASIHCTGDLASGRTPVLLVPGTGEDPDFFSWNYIPALGKLGLPFCTVTLPEHGTGDIQVAAEYVVYAIRRVHGAAGRRIAVLGHSQGGMVPRWALRFWPDTRAMVDDLVALAPSNHGTTSARPVCSSSCNAATWQQRDDARFIAALNAPQETFAGISYTDVYTHDDEVVTPNADASGSSSLHTGDGRITNAAVQDLCPADPSEHLALGSSDAVGYALFVDAITHDGPADPARIDPAVCSQLAQPGVNPATYATDSSSSYATVLANFASGAQLSAEPPLRCYATGTCASGSQGSGAGSGSSPARPRLLVAVRPHSARLRHAVVLHVRVRARRDGRLVAVRGARVTVAGAHARTDRHGRATLHKRLGFEHAGRYTLHARRARYRTGRATIRVRR